MLDNRSQFLKSWLDEFALSSLENFGIRVTTSINHSGLFNLKYNSIVENRSLPIVRACRGSVVEYVNGEWQVVAYAFDRFFNYGEPEADELDWNNEIKVYEKYDGSLIKLFYWNDEWIVSTSGSVDGRTEVNGHSVSFRELFWEVFEQKWYNKKYLEKELVYIFELCHPYNRVVVNYKNPELRLITVRDKTNYFNELNLDDFACQFDVADSHNFRDIHEVRDMASLIKGTEHEGFVIKDVHGNRIKIKGSDYVNLHRIRCNGSPSFVDLWKRDDVTEFLIHFPEYQNEFNYYLNKIQELNELTDKFVTEYYHLEQKEFAHKVLQSGMPTDALFMLRKGKVNSFAEWLYQQPDRKVLSYLK